MVKSLLGLKFGKLEPQKYIGKQMWKCRCECGHYRNVRADHLLRGEQKTCGCGANESRGPRQNLSGKKIGHLRVIKFVSKFDSKNSGWLCKCICGKEVYKETNHLKNNCSCGCQRNLAGSKSPRWTGYEEIHGRIWTVLMNNAKRRDIKFDLKIEDVWSLFLKQNRKCALSGVDIWFPKTKREMSKSTASLDRIDSSKGYTIDNVQWVHKMVQVMKMAFDQTEFINMCQKISDLSRKC